LRPHPGDPPPSRIRFPDGSERDLKTWKSLLLEVAEWLVAQGKLTAAACPVPKSPKGYIVHTEPRHPDGRQFAAGNQLSNGLWVDCYVGSTGAIRQAQILLRHVGEDPSAYAVRW
jgi:hypothetical protein